VLGVASLSWTAIGWRVLSTAHIYVLLPTGTPAADEPTAVAERVFEEVCVLWLPEGVPPCTVET